MIAVLIPLHGISSPVATPTAAAAPPHTGWSDPRRDAPITHLLPGTEVHARGLRWEIVFSQQLGAQTLYRLCGLEDAVRGREMDVLHPLEPGHAIELLHLVLYYMLKLR